MPSAMVTFNGRITLPPHVRKQLGLKTGDNVEFVEIGNGRFAIAPGAGIGSGRAFRFIGLAAKVRVFLKSSIAALAESVAGKSFGT